MNPSFIQVIAILLLTGVAAFTDLRSGKIPNWLTISGGVAGLPWGFYAFGMRGLLGGLLGGLICFLVPGLIFFWSKGRAIGGGDLKLFAALGAWVGVTRGLEIQLGALVLVLCFALVQVAFHGQLLRTGHAMLKASFGFFRSNAANLEERQLALTEVRMGPCIFAATFVSAMLEAQVL